MKEVISVGVSVKRFGGVVAFKGDSPIFNSQSSSTLDGIQLTANKLKEVLASYPGVPVYICVDGFDEFERQIGVWQGSLMSVANHTIVANYSSWFSAMVAPYIDKTEVFNSDSASQLVAAKFAPNLFNSDTHYHFTDAYHLCRYANMVGQNIEATLQAKKG